MKHTDTPWLTVPGKAFIYALDENGVNRFQASIDGAHCPGSELIDNARHIVRCVNNHELIKGKLKTLRDSISGDCYMGEEWELETIDAILGGMDEG